MLEEQVEIVEWVGSPMEWMESDPWMDSYDRLPTVAS